MKETLTRNYLTDIDNRPPVLGEVRSRGGVDMMCVRADEKTFEYDFQAITGGLTFGRLAAYAAVRSKVSWGMGPKEITPQRWWGLVSGEIEELQRAMSDYNAAVAYKEDPDYTAEMRTEALKEVADVVQYLDLMCQSMDASLEEVIRDKFNEVNKRPHVQFKGDL